MNARLMLGYAIFGFGVAATAGAMAKGPVQPAEAYLCATFLVVGSILLAKDRP